MHSRKNIFLLWVMLLCAVFMTEGCKKDMGKEDTLISVGQTDITADTEDGESEEDQEAKDAGGNAEKRNSEAEETGVIYVDVCGQVKNPGVYQLTGESRVYEAIEKAGGMTKEASAASVNQAECLTDGQQIYIPSEDEQKENREGGSAPAAGEAASSNTKAGMAAGRADDGRINLNTASREELLTLTGIGDVKADSIIRYREEKGGFQSVEDIKKIEGIKDGVFNKIKDRITV